MMNRRYYVYAILDPRKSGEFIFGHLQFNLEPFYIGKGLDKRFLQSINDVNNSKLKKQRIADIRKSGFEPISIKLYENLSEDLSYLCEKEVISQIGLQKNNGFLVNVTHGSSKRGTAIIAIEDLPDLCIII